MHGGDAGADAAVVLVHGGTAAGESLRAGPSRRLLHGCHKRKCAPYDVMSAASCRSAPWVVNVCVRLWW